MADIVRELNTPSKRDRVTISPATSGSTLITVEMELHRSPFTYASETKHFSFQQIAQAVTYAKQLADANNLRIEGNYPRGCGLPDGGNFANWQATPDDEEYRDLCEPEEPAACLRFLHRWGRNASTRAKSYGEWESRRDPSLPEGASPLGEMWYFREISP